jgi:hypothetical protein
MEMRKTRCFLALAACALLLLSPAAYSGEEISYARCNLKVLEGNEYSLFDIHHWFDAGDDR